MSIITSNHQEILKSTTTLLRLLNLQSSQDPDDISYQERLKDLWDKSMEKLKHLPLEAVKVDFINELWSLDLQDVYLPQLQEATTKEECKELSREFARDIDSIVVSPLKKSTRGQKGPTFLVSYPREVNTREIAHQAYVIKWTQQTELSCTRIFQQFSEWMDNSFSTPMCSALDFEKKIHELPDGTRIPLETKANKQLSTVFQQIAKNVAPRHPLPDKLIMLSKRINGENLFDFAMTKYGKLLKKERVSLLTEMGKIAMLDLFLGNLDRLIQINWDGKKKCYSLLDCEANLGNLLVRWKGDAKKPKLYAIDNGIDESLINDKEKRKVYKLFLENLNSQPNGLECLADNMVISFQHALNTQVDDSRKNVAVAKQKLQAFSKDINAIGKKCFINGLKEMRSALQSRLFPQWNSPSNSCKGYLFQVQPSLLNSIEERLGILGTVKEKKPPCGNPPLSPVQNNPTPQSSQVELSPQSDKKTAAWLQLVGYHGQSGSSESREIVHLLSSQISRLNISSQPTELQMFTNDVEKAASKGEFNPKLSPTGKKILSSMSTMRRIDPNNKSACARKLDFSNVDSSDFSL